MDFDISKLEKLSLSKTKKDNLNLSEDEIKFMKDIFDSILNSDNQDTIIEYLSGIHGLSISNIKLIRNVYFYFLASREEQIEYTKIKTKNKKIRRKEGFIDTTAMISITIFLSVVGLTLALILYNLM